MTDPRTDDDGHDELVRLYGPWAGRTPDDARRLFADLPALWWVTGGWALEAFTGVRRPHADCDLSILRSDLPALRRLMAGRLDVWTATAGALAPLLPEDRTDAPAEEVLPPGCGQVWTRASALDPWEYDVTVVPGDARTWVYRRDARLALPMERAIWDRDGVRYLQPEIQLLYKAKGRRPKDEADFDATLPHLDRDRRTWLADALDLTLPGHPWREEL